MIENKSQLVTW